MPSQMVYMYLNSFRECYKVSVTVILRIIVELYPLIQCILFLIESFPRLQGVAATMIILRELKHSVQVFRDYNNIHY